MIIHYPYILIRYSDLAHTAYRGVALNTVRSLLTMLGIIIGVCAVVLMTGIGKSMEGLILGQISTLGTRSMVIFPGSGPEGGEGLVKAGYDSLTAGDVEAIGRLESIMSIAPIVFVRGEVRFGREQSAATVVGTVQNFFVNQSIEASDGRLLNQADEEGAKNVAVLGPDTASDLFPGSDPLGKGITIGGRSFTVVGVTESVGSQFFQNFDDRVYVPLSVAKIVTGQKYVNYLTFQASESFDLAFADVRALLRRRHGIHNSEDDEKKDDFVARSSEQAFDILGTVSLSLTLFITLIAGISLVVGGIGIMNIMLVAVTERTQEIGLRKALGARGWDILLQFLCEAVLLTIVGSIIGIVAGIVLAHLIALVVHRFFLESYAFALSPEAMLVALLVAVATGLLFGISPARRAASLPPIQALRYE